jgi:hypothetical protein
VSALGRPAVLASLLAAAALCLHPALRSAQWLPAHGFVVAALLLACAAGLVARALEAAAGARLAAGLLAAGALIAIAGLGLDGVRGQRGTLLLSVGQARNHFDEVGPEGRPLGLRPLGFTVALDGVTPEGGVRLAVAGRAVPLEVTADRAAAFGGYRFAQPRVRATGGAALLRVSVTDGKRTELADVTPGGTVEAAGVAIALEQYFPDFALDDRQQPFNRSLEPRNPAALLTVVRDGQAHRAFVIRSLPGVHRVEPLGLTFSLLDVVPDEQVELGVHRAAPWALEALAAGGVLLALGLALRALRPPPSQAPAASAASLDPALPAAAIAVAALLIADGARLVSWSFGVPSAAGRVPLPGVGVFLALALLALGAGTLWLGAVALAGQGDPQPARGALWLGVSIGACGVLFAAVRVAAQAQTTASMARPVAGIALALVLLALALRGAPAWLPHAAAAVAVLAALAGAWLGLVQEGTHASLAATAGLATVLLGLSAILPTRLEPLRRLVFLLALVGLLVSPA